MTFPCRCHDVFFFFFVSRGAINQLHNRKIKSVVGVLQASSSCGQGGENPVSGYVHVLDMCLALGHLLAAPRKRKPSAAGSLPSCCVTAVKIPSKFDLPSTAKNLPSKNEKPSTAKNLPSCCVTAVKIPSKFDLPSTAKTLPSKRENRLPPKSYRHVALPSRPSPSKISLPNTALKFCSFCNFQVRAW